MFCIAEIGWIEIVIGGVIGTIIGLFAQHILDYIFGFRILRPLIGEYTVTYKNGKLVEKNQTVKITKVKGRILVIETMNEKEISPVESEIYFHTPKSGNGWYRHTDSDAFGLREVVKMDDNKIAVWNKYTKDGAYKKTSGNNDIRMYSSIEQSFIWTKNKQ